MKIEIINEALELIKTKWTDQLSAVFLSDTPREWYHAAPNSVARFLLLVVMYSQKKDPQWIAQYMNLWRQDQNTVTQDVWMLPLDKKTYPLIEKVHEAMSQHNIHVLKINRYYLSGGLYNKDIRAGITKIFTDAGMQWDYPYLLLKSENMDFNPLKNNMLTLASLRHLYWDDFENQAKAWLKQPDATEINTAWRINAIFWNEILFSPHVATASRDETVASYAMERMFKTLTWSKPAKNADNLRAFVESWNTRSTRVGLVRIFAKIPHPYAVSLYVALWEYQRSLISAEDKLALRGDLSRDVLSLLITERYKHIAKLKTGHKEKELLGNDLWLVRQLFTSRNAPIPNWDTKLLSTIKKDHTTPDEKVQLQDMINVARNLEQPGLLLNHLLDMLHRNPVQELDIAGVDF